MSFSSNQTRGSRSFAGQSPRGAPGSAGSQFPTQDPLQSTQASLLPRIRQAMASRDMLFGGSGFGTAPFGQTNTTGSGSGGAPVIRPPGGPVGSPTGGTRPPRPGAPPSGPGGTRTPYGEVPGGTPPRGPIDGTTTGGTRPPRGGTGGGGTGGGGTGGGGTGGGGTGGTGGGTGGPTGGTGGGATGSGGSGTGGGGGRGDVEPVGGTGGLTAGGGANASVRSGVGGPPQGGGPMQFSQQLAQLPGAGVSPPSYQPDGAAAMDLPGGGMGMLETPLDPNGGMTVGTPTPPVRDPRQGGAPVAPVRQPRPPGQQAPEVTPASTTTPPAAAAYTAKQDVRDGLSQLSPTQRQAYDQAMGQIDQGGAGEFLSSSTAGRVGRLVRNGATPEAISGAFGSPGREQAYERFALSHGGGTDEFRALNNRFLPQTRGGFGPSSGGGAGTLPGPRPRGEVPRGGAPVTMPQGSPVSGGGRPVGGSPVGGAPSGGGRPPRMMAAGDGTDRSNLTATLPGATTPGGTPITGLPGGGPLMNDEHGDDPPVLYDGDTPGGGSPGTGTGGPPSSGAGNSGYGSGDGYYHPDRWGTENFGGDNNEAPTGGVVGAIDRLNQGMSATEQNDLYQAATRPIAAGLSADRELARMRMAQTGNDSGYYEGQALQARNADVAQSDAARNVRNDITAENERRREEGDRQRLAALGMSDAEINAYMAQLQGYNTTGYDTAQDAEGDGFDFSGIIGGLLSNI